MSVYQSCHLTAAGVDALSKLRQRLAEERQAFDVALADVKDSLDGLSSPAVKASAVVGSQANNQIRWEAVDAGPEGNEISITYVYLGPVATTGGFVGRNPSIEVAGNAIRCSVGVNSSGEVTGSAASHLVFWLADAAVTRIVSAELVGAGTVDIDGPLGPVYLTGGKGSPLADAESAANSVAQVFGSSNYEDFMQAAGMCTLGDGNTDYPDSNKTVSIGGKLFIVEGTGLVAYNKLFEIFSRDIASIRAYVNGLSSGDVSLLTTQNVETVRYELVCSERQEIISITETYRNRDTNALETRDTFGGTLDAYNHYVFWAVYVNPIQKSILRIDKWGFLDRYEIDILSGISPQEEEGVSVPAPELYTIEDLGLLDKLDLTDVELADLLSRGIDGVRLPEDMDIDARTQALNNALKDGPVVQNNGTRCRAKGALAALPNVDPAATLEDDDLTKELGIRGNACARLEAAKNPDFLQRIGGTLNSLSLPTLDEPTLTALANVPSTSLPSGAQAVESAFGTLSGAVESSNKAFDSSLSNLTDTITEQLNKVQNVITMAENLLDNDIAKCLLGATQAATGAPSFAFGAATGNSVPTLDAVAGGLSVGLDLLVLSLQGLQLAIETSVALALDTAMIQIKVPLGIAQSLIDSVAGFDLGGLENPCKDGAASDDKCDPTAVQALIDRNESASAQLDQMPSVAKLPNTKKTVSVETGVQAFTGSVQSLFETKQLNVDGNLATQVVGAVGGVTGVAEATLQDAADTGDAVTRGIEKIYQDLKKAIDTKLGMIDEIVLAVQDVASTLQELQDTAARKKQEASSFAPPELGLFGDSISALLD